MPYWNVRYGTQKELRVYLQYIWQGLLLVIVSFLLPLNLYLFFLMYNLTIVISFLYIVLRC